MRTGHNSNPAYTMRWENYLPCVRGFACRHSRFYLQPRRRSATDVNTAATHQPAQLATGRYELRQWIYGGGKMLPSLVA
jgi:hypothetical protein